MTAHTPLQHQGSQNPPQSPLARARLAAIRTNRPSARPGQTRRRARALARWLSFLIWWSSAVIPAVAAPLCEAEMAKASATYDVPLGILYSVGLTETGQRGLLDPFAMNIDGRSTRSASLADALTNFNAAVAHGAKLIDIGCMQINQRWHGQDFASVQEMFDIRRNVDYAARFLRGLRASEGSWTMAVARYNAGPANPAAQHAYVCAVIRSMVQSGAGGWTPRARAYCG